jgi:hypothetical protein
VSRELPKKRCVSLAVSQTLPFTREPSYGLSVFGIEKLKCEVMRGIFGLVYGLLANLSISFRTSSF